MRFFLLAVSSVGLLLILNGCVSYDRLVNFKKGAPLMGTDIIQNAPDIKIQPDDVLSIKVFGANEETAAPFNLTPTTNTTDFVNIESIQLTGYLVNKSGVIDFPVLGPIEVKGLTVSEAKERIKDLLMIHLKDPIVNVRLLNFKVTVSGEVINPGSFNVINERITILEALTAAGDLTSYADRSNILIVREENGIRSYGRVDVQATNLFQSEFFYLKQNDYLYVEPIRAKTGSVLDQTNKTIPVIAATATLIAVLLSITNN